MTTQGERESDAALAELERLRTEVDRLAAALSDQHRARLQCRAGCAQCCIDDLSVHEVEAEAIRRAHPRLLSEGTPHTDGACAFLDSELRCRIYEERPYICRSQGLPLRWFASGEGDDDASVQELRDICPLNLEGESLEFLPDEACWLLGPFESRLAQIADHFDGGHRRRIHLRELFRGGD